jgi:hypothetical protein
MSMRVSWRYFRTDLLAIACLGVVATCLVFEWPAWAMVALGLAVFCAISPRMKGYFGLTAGMVRLGGTLDDSQEVILEAEVSELREDRRAGDRGPLSNREPPAD